jgi:hypothetical protein
MSRTADTHERYPKRPRRGYADFMTVTVDRLRQRLERIEALHRGATTAGERLAAARARDRLAAHIDRIRSSDPVARFVRAHLQELGVGPPAPRPPATLPTETQILAVLASWEAGEWTWHEVHAWATVQVDSVDLPLSADDDGVARAEILLQLAMLHRVGLHPSDVPAIRLFLRERDWDSWFRLVARAPRSRRR